MAKDPLRVKRLLIHGIVITIPMVITLLVLIVVFDFILGVLSPIVDAVAYVWSDEPPTAVVQVATLLSLVGLFLLVGLVAALTPGKHISRMVDETMASIPGVSVIYTGVRRASDVLIDDDTDQFQDVKLIEFPHEDAYMLSFLIGEPPATIEDSLEVGEMLTLMVPLGPNPTTNGFIMHMPAEHVHDVDITVEEAIRSIATLGVAEEGVTESG